VLLQEAGRRLLEHDGRGFAALVVSDQSQRLQVAAGELAVGCERLGSRSEVERFRVEPLRSPAGRRSAPWISFFGSLIVNFARSRCRSQSVRKATLVVHVVFCVMGRNLP
jgi:hypothetical protein